MGCLKVLILIVMVNSFGDTEKTLPEIPQKS